MNFQINEIVLVKCQFRQFEILKLAKIIETKMFGSVNKVKVRFYYSNLVNWQIANKIIRYIQIRDWYQININQSNLFSFWRKYYFPVQLINRFPLNKVFNVKYMYYENSQEIINKKRLLAIVDGIAYGLISPSQLLNLLRKKYD